MARVLAQPQHVREFAPVLRERGAAFTPELAACWRSLFSGGPTWNVESGDVTSQWRFFWPPAVGPAGWWLCNGASHALALALDSDHWCQDIGPRAWSDYSDDSRRFAWRLAHRSLLAHLGALLGDTLDVTKEATALPPQLRAAKIEFQVESAEGSARGLLAVTAEAAQCLTAWSQRPLPPVTERAGAAWPLPVEIWLRDLQLPRCELQMTRVGDILLLGRRDVVAADVRLVAGAGHQRRAATARYEDNRLTVGQRGFQLLRDHEAEVGMSDNDNEATAEAPDKGDESAVQTTQPESVGDADMPIRLQLHLGDVALSLSDLASLRPGYVIDLEQTLEQVSVDLYAGGRRIGRGEMVVVGDSLGVRLREIGVDGVR